MKTKTCEAAGTMRHRFRRLGDGCQAILGETAWEVTPFGGLAVMVELWREVGLMMAVRERLPFAYAPDRDNLTSLSRNPVAIAPANRKSGSPLFYSG